MKALSKLSDLELIHLFVHGNEKAFSVLFQRYQSNLYKVIVYYVKDRVLAEDLLQESFIKIFSSIQANRYCEEGKFLQWALRIAHNLCMDYLRKPNRTSFVTNFSQTAFAFETTPSPETAVMNAQASHQLNLLVNALPDDQKKVVYYRHFEEQSFKEIAERMNTSVNTSLGRMRYGLMHLRRMIENDPGFTGS